jgi:hypothetical protein
MKEYFLFDELYSQSTEEKWSGEIEYCELENSMKSEYLILAIFCTRASECRVALDSVVAQDSCIRLA